MCGIIGWAGRIGRTQDDPSAAFLAARDLMASRGPDGKGEVALAMRSGDVLRLGHRRLSIIDVSERGAQPMWSDCGRYVITYNGEVYNAPGLRAELAARGRRFASTSDTEVIVNGYAEWGGAIVPRLDGMFAFAIWDTVDETLFLVRDRVGIKPLYVSCDEAGIAFASDLRSLRRIGLGEALDPEALGAYLMLGYVPTPLSIFRGVSKLEAGSTLLWRHGASPVVRRYWAPPEEPGGDGEPDLDALGQLIDAVTREQLISDVPLGLFLSGGLDSSLIASSAVRASNALEALTVGYSRSTTDDEAPIAARTAECLGLPLRRVDLDGESADGFIDPVFDALDEPLGYSAIVSQLAVSMAARRAGYKVVLSGDGGDEVFGGYRWYDRPDAPDASFRQRFGHLSSRLLGPLAPEFAREAARRESEAAFTKRSLLHAHLHAVFPSLRPEEIPEIAERIEPARAEDVAIEALARHDAPRLPLKRRMQRIDLMTFCQDSVLPKVDRTSMAVGLEVRPPLLDHRIVEWGLAQPISEVCDGQPKGAVRHLLADRGLGFLLDEKKRGFSVKGVPQLSQKAMARALDGIDQIAAPLRPRPAARIDPLSHSFKMKVQTMYFYVRWMEAMQAREGS